MTSRTIEIIVSPTGQTQVETSGFAGSECRRASQFIEQALGQQTSEPLTADSQNSASTTTDEQLRQQG